MALKPPSGPGPQARCAWSGGEGPGIPRWMTRSETPWENYTMLRSWVVADCVASVPSLEAQLSESSRGGDTSLCKGGGDPPSR